jgi:hypothetical protein
MFDPDSLCKVQTSDAYSYALPPLSRAQSVPSEAAVTTVATAPFGSAPMFVRTPTITV